MADIFNLNSKLRSIKPLNIYKTIGGKDKNEIIKDLRIKSETKSLAKKLENDPHIKQISSGKSSSVSKMANHINQNYGQDAKKKFLTATERHFNAGMTMQEKMRKANIYFYNQQKKAIDERRVADQKEKKRDITNRDYGYILEKNNLGDANSNQLGDNDGTVMRAQSETRFAGGVVKSSYLRSSIQTKQSPNTGFAKRENKLMQLN